MNFIERLNAVCIKNRSLVCVGLDPEPAKLPKCLQGKEDPVFEFAKAIVDATRDDVAAYKPNIAFYEENGPQGLVSLKRTIEHIKKAAPDAIVILDAKRGDIGNTAQAYARALFGHFGADCVTLSPYLGWDSLSPFLGDASRGAFVLCKTSNPSGKELQDVKVALEGKEMKFYQYVAHLSKTWNKLGNVGLVVGATYPEELKDVRTLVGEDIPLLIPGVGAQGGDLEKAVRAGCSSKGLGAIINSSRGILFKDSSPDFARHAGIAAKELKDQINSFR